MATFYNDAINQDARNVLQKQVGALTSSSGKRDIPSGLVGSFYNNEISLEDLTSRINGSPTFNPNIGPQIDYGQGKQSLTQAQTQALTGGKSITDVANMNFPSSTVTPNDIQNGASKTYTVQAGDTLGAIASRMGVPISSITGYKSGDINKIGVGEVLTIGGKGTSAIDPKAIPTNTIVPTTPIGVTTPTATTPSTAGAYGDTVTKTLDQYIKEAQSATKSAAEVQQDSLTARLSDLLGQTAGQTQALSTAEAEQGVPDLTKQLQDINNQIKTTRAEQNALNVDVQGKPITMSSIIGAQAQINAVMDAKIYTLSAQAQALQGNISLAKENAQKAVDLKYAPILEELKIKQAQLELIRPTLTKEEKIRAEALAQKNKDEANALQLQIANQKDQNSTLLNLMQSYPDARITLSDTLESANTKITNNSAIYKDKIKNTGSGTGRAGVLASLPTSVQTQLTGIAEKFGSTDIVKKYNEVSDGLSKIRGVENGSTNPADHQQVVYAFAKYLDPTSAVKEGEYEVIKKYAQSTISKYGKEITNAINGTGFLSEQAIANIKATMERGYISTKEKYDNLYAEKSRIINNLAGVDVAQDIMIDYAKGVGGSSNNIEQKIIDFGTKNPAYQGIITKASNDISNPEDLLQFLRSVLPSPLLTQLQ